MTETNESSAPRPFEPTPEATMTDDASSRSSGSTAESQSDAGNTRSQQTPPKDAVADAAHDIAERLKPVAAMAETVAVKAIELSSKGLDRLAGYLKERQQTRGGAAGNPPTDDRAG